MDIPKKEEKMLEFLNDTQSSVSEKEDESTQLIHQDGKQNLLQRAMREDGQTELIGSQQSDSNETELIRSEGYLEDEPSNLVFSKRDNALLKIESTSMTDQAVKIGIPEDKEVTEKKELSENIEVSEKIEVSERKEQSVKIESSAQKRPSRRTTSWVLHLVDRENGGRVFEKVVKEVIIIGRKYELCDIAIDYDKTVSSRQCKVYIKNKKLYVSDLGGTNITYLNDKPLREDAILNTGDVLGFGRINLRVTLL